MQAQAIAPVSSQSSTPSPSPSASQIPSPSPSQTPSSSTLQETAALQALPSVCPAAKGGDFGAMAELLTSTPLQLESSGYIITVSFTEFRMCSHLQLIIRSTAPDNGRKANDSLLAATPELSSPDWPSNVQIFASFYTVQSRGEPCTDITADNCTLMSRQLPITRHDHLDAHVATFVPDPASKHYFFSVKVWILSTRVWHKRRMSPPW